MKIAIRYDTRSKKGNTQKLAEFISNRLGLPLVDISSPLEEKVDALILANALYAANIDGSVKDFLAANKD